MVNLAKHNEERIDSVRSQKASVLLKYSHKYNEDEYSDKTWKTLDTLIIQLDDDPTLALDWFHERLFSLKHSLMFVRTCPENPRHGVLESTAVTIDTIEEVIVRLQDIMLSGTTVEYEGETLQVEPDPNGCLIVQPFVEATSSAVYAPGMHVTVGKGHEGITAGTDGISLAFPVRASSHENWVWDGMDLDPSLHQLEFIADFDKHIEDRSVAHRKYGMSDMIENYLVQIRGCDGNFPIVPPPQGVSINGSVPCGRIEVKEVWVASGLESVAWLEANITKDTVPAGYVISEPSGSLSSHIAAHAKSHELPYIVSEVNVGDSWVEAAAGWVINDPEGVYEPQPWDATPYSGEFLDGVRYANLHWRHQHGWFSTFFHQWWSHPHKDIPSTAYLGGVFVGWMLKACFGLCLGEMRHAVLTHKKKNLTPATALFMQAVVGHKRFHNLEDSNNGGTISGNRVTYYDLMLKNEVDWTTLPNLFKVMAKFFNTGWTSGYGGPKWGNAAEVGAQAAEALVAMLESPTPENTRHLVAKANLLENVTHNNGFLYNKYLDKMAFNVGTDGFPSDNWSSIFYTYELALDVLEDNLDDMTSPQHTDWRVIGDFFINKTPKYWKDNPLFLNDDLPQVLKDERKFLEGNTSYLHGTTSHQYGDHNDDGFITCGHPDCYDCKKHSSYLAVKKEIPKAIADDGIPYDVWVAGEDENVKQSPLDEVDIEPLVLLDYVDITTLDMVNYYEEKEMNDIPSFKEYATNIAYISAGYYHAHAPLKDKDVTNSPVTWIELIVKHVFAKLSDTSMTKSGKSVVSAWIPSSFYTWVQELLDYETNKEEIICALKKLEEEHQTHLGQACLPISEYELHQSLQLSKKDKDLTSTKTIPANLIVYMDKLLLNGEKVCKTVYNYVNSVISSHPSTKDLYETLSQKDATVYDCDDKGGQNGLDCLSAVVKQYMDDVAIEEDEWEKVEYFCAECKKAHAPLMYNFTNPNHPPLVWKETVNFGTGKTDLSFGTGKTDTEEGC